MPRNAFALAAIVLMTAALHAQTTAAAPAPPAGIPKEWAQIKAGSDFTFWAPPDLKKTNAVGIDSFVGDYESPGMKLGFDYGWYSDPLDTSEYKREAITLDGRKAFLARSDKGVGVYVPDVDGKGNAKSAVKLEMFIVCDKATTDQAVLVLKSIQFTAPAEPPATTKP